MTLIRHFYNIQLLGKYKHILSDKKYNLNFNRATIQYNILYCTKFTQIIYKINRNNMYNKAALYRLERSLPGNRWSLELYDIKKIKNKFIRKIGKQKSIFLVNDFYFYY